MAYTEEQLKNAARKALAAGDKAAAKRLVDAARKAGAASTPVVAKSTEPAEALAGPSDDRTWGEDITEFGKAALESATFGVLGDEFRSGVKTGFGYLTGDDRTYQDYLEQQRQQEEEFREANPNAALVADIGGGVIGSIVVPGSLVGRGAGMIAKTGLSAATGAAGGAAYGFAEGEGLEDRVDRAKTGAVLGGLVGAAAPAVVNQGGKIVTALKDGRAITAAGKGAASADELLERGGRAYERLGEMGAFIKPERIAAFTTDTVETMKDGGLREAFGRKLTPASAELADVIREQGSKVTPTSMRDLQTLRELADVPASSVNNTRDAALGTTAINKIDELVDDLEPADMVRGDPDAIRAALSEGRDNYARGMRAMTIEEAISAADNQQAGFSSGIRNKLKTILDSPAKRRGFSDSELSLMKQIVDGNGLASVLKNVGGGLGQVGGALTGVGMTALANPVAGAASVIVPLGAKKISEKLSRRAAERLRDVVANGRGVELSEIDPARLQQLGDILVRASVIPTVNAANESSGDQEEFDMAEQERKRRREALMDALMRSN